MVLNLPSGATLATAKKVAAAKAAAAKKLKAKSKSGNPPTAEMVESAIKALKEKGGSSFPAIKKYIAANYNVDAEKHALFIKKYLKSSVVAKKIVQVKGKGSFKLSQGETSIKSSPKAKRPAPKKSVKNPSSPLKKSTVTKPKKSPVKKSLKKPATPKKALKTLTAKPPKPKVRKAPKPTKKPSKPLARKTISKVKKSPAKKTAVKK